MARINPIVFIPPVVLLLAITGILIYRYLDNIQDTYHRALYRLRGDQYLDGAEGEEFLHEEDYEVDDDSNAEEDNQSQAEPQGSTTSARLRMHHEMVQQMRARAGFAPEPFPGDEQQGGTGRAEEEDADDDGEEGVEDEGGAGPSTGAVAGGRMKKIGKKKAEKLQRKEQMRAYREFMDMQREERRQQEEMFKIQEEMMQEERRRKRREQVEKDRRRKEQLKEKEAKERDLRMKRLKSEKIKDEKVRRELRAYIQRVKSFRLSTLAKRLGRTEAQLLKDLAVVAQEDELRAVSYNSSSSSSSAADGTSGPQIILAPNLTTSISLANTGISISPSTSPMLAQASTSTFLPKLKRLLIVYDGESEQYVVLNESQLNAFAEVVRQKGRVDQQELHKMSEDILAVATNKSM